MGDAGVTVNAEKEGVNDLDHRIRPPYCQLTVMQVKVYVSLLWCDIDTWSSMLSRVRYLSKV
jgi:hypothetical protein